MITASRSRWALNMLGLLAICATVGIGFTLRLADPLSSPVVPAEDPYTHMALVREHLRTGTLEPLTPGSGLYPPGMHSFIAAVWVYTGADLYEIVRLGPAVLGAIGILGTALLLWRHEGPIAAFVGSLAFALAPEAIFRTTMMSPTALDLAILPFYLYAVLELVTGRLAWAAPGAVLSVFLLFAHPWLFGILAVAGLVFCLLVYILPWPSTRAPRLSVLGLAAAIALVGGGLGLALSTCSGGCGAGFQEVAPPLAAFGWLAPVVTVMALLPVVVVALRRRRLHRAAAARPRAPPKLWFRISLSTALAGILVLTTVPALRHGMPENVKLLAMLGWPLLALAVVGLLVLPFVGGPLGYLGAALVAATYPMVVYNLLDSPFLPHRTVVYLAFGCVALAGVATGALARWALLAGPAAARFVARTGSSRTRAALALVPVLLVTGSLGGTVYAQTPDAYGTGWYRLYPACELAGLRSVAGIADGEPAGVVVTGDYQSKLVLAALTSNASRVWYKVDLYTSDDHDWELRSSLEREARPLFLVVDRYLRPENPDIDTTFLSEPTWHLAGTWCSGMGFSQPRLSLYTAGATE